MNNNSLQYFTMYVIYNENYNIEKYLIASINFCHKDIKFWFLDFFLIYIIHDVSWKSMAPNRNWFSEKFRITFCNYDSCDKFLHYYSTYGENLYKTFYTCYRKDIHVLLRVLLLIFSIHLAIIPNETATIWQMFKVIFR